MGRLGDRKQNIFLVRPKHGSFVVFVQGDINKSFYIGGNRGSATYEGEKDAGSSSKPVTDLNTHLCYLP